MERENQSFTNFSSDINQHAHHWRIEEAMGPTSIGCCKNCGAEKEFRNWLTEDEFVLSDRYDNNRRINEARNINY